MRLMLTWSPRPEDSLRCKISNWEQVSCGHLVISLSGSLSAFLYIGGWARSQMMQTVHYNLSTPRKKYMLGTAESVDARIEVSGERKGDDYVAARWHAETG